MQRMVHILFLWASAVLLFGVLPTVSQVRSAPDDGLAIIVNQSNTVENLSAADLRKTFLGEKSHWPNGRRITLIMRDPGPERKVVLREIYGMNEADFKDHFIRGLFTGEVFVSPKTMATPVEVCKFVSNVPGAIGYVWAAEADSSVKIVRVDGHLPHDKEYKLRIQRPSK